MLETIPAPRLAQLSEFLSKRIGLQFCPARMPDLRRGVAAAVEEFGFNDSESCIDWLLSGEPSPLQLDTFTAHLTVGETYLFREPKLFEALERQILPKLIRERRSGRKRLRVWSAGCATGEETYTLAIVLARLLPDLADWQVSIMGSDINRGALHKAEAGQFGEWSFRDAPGWLKQCYFQQTADGKFQIAHWLRKMVSFSYLNLAEDVYPTLLTDTCAMDLILCRNVLLYFTPECAERVVARFHDALVEGGYLALGAVELITSKQFVRESVSGAVCYRKSKANAAPVPTLRRDQAYPLFRKEVTGSPENAPGLIEKLPMEDGRGSATERGSAAEPPIVERARASANAGRLGEALTLCSEAIEADKFNPARHYLHATILLERGQVRDAEQALKHALYLDPEFALAYFALGSIERKRGSVVEARKHFRNALRLLAAFKKDEVPSDAEGITVGRLVAIIEASMD